MENRRYLPLLSLLVILAGVPTAGAQAVPTPVPLAGITVRFPAAKLFAVRNVQCARYRSGWQAGELIRGTIQRGGDFVSHGSRAALLRTLALRVKNVRGKEAEFARLMARYAQSKRLETRENPICRNSAPATIPPTAVATPVPNVTPNVPPVVTPGTPNASCPVSAADGVEDTSDPTSVVGNGTPASCTGAAFVQAVAKGGIITFDCGPNPVTITLSQTAKVVNSSSKKIVIDGGNKVTLSGDNKVRILYQNTCDSAQNWTTPHCQNQDHPKLVVQNLTFVGGNSKNNPEEGGGAIFVRGGLLKIVNSRFYRNVCDNTGPDVGGGAVRVLSIYNDTPVPVVNSVFGGSVENGNVCSNGGALSAIGVSFKVINSTISHNKAIGNGANPAQAGTPGGGSGAGIYNDGNTFNLSICGSNINNNTANEGGGAIFFVSNDRTGTLRLENSVLKNNQSKGFESAGYPGIFVIARNNPTVINSVVE